MASALVQWAAEQLDLFATLFKRQLEDQTDPEDLKEALSVMRAQSNKLLRDNNLDFSYLLDDLLVDIKKPLHVHTSAKPENVTSPIEPDIPALTKSPRGGRSPLVLSASSDASLEFITPLPISRVTTPKSVPPLSPSRSTSRPMTPRATHSHVPSAPPPRSRDRQPSS